MTKINPIYPPPNRHGVENSQNANPVLFLNIISKNSPIENGNFCYWLNLRNIAHVVTIRKMTKSALVA